LSLLQGQARRLGELKKGVSTKGKLLWSEDWRREGQ